MLITSTGARLPRVTEYAIYGFFGEYRFLSNFAPAPLVLPEDGILYPTSEHAYMAQKTVSLPLRRELAALSTPQDAREAGLQLSLRLDWAVQRLHAMLAALRAKFGQNPELAERLLATGQHYLEETNNWDDRFWGVVDGEGLNMLGKMLMQVRNDLRESARRLDGVVH